jgi:MFS family permease
MTAIAYSHQFLAATFERTWGWTAAQYAYANGVALLIIAPVNMALAGVLTDRWTARGIPDAALRYMYAGFLLILPTAVLPYFLPTGTLAFAVLCLNTIGIGMVTAVAITALLPITPASVRGQLIALYYLAISLIGSLGPVIAGQLSSKVFGEEHLGYALACVPLIVGAVPLAMMPGTRRRYLALLARLEDSR